MAECEVAAVPKAPVPPPPPPRASHAAAAAAAATTINSTNSSSATSGNVTMQLNGTVQITDGTATSPPHNGAAEGKEKPMNNNTERATFFKNSKLSLENKNGSCDSSHQVLIINGSSTAGRDRCDNAASGAGDGSLDGGAVCVNGLVSSDGTAESARSSNKADREGAGSSNADSDDQSASSRRLRLENERLQAEVSRLRCLLQQSGELDTSEEAEIEGGDRMSALEHELRLAKEAVSELRIERKRLRGEKSELLSHVRQLCASLQDKEQELRDFIRNYDQQRTNSDRDRERWSLLRHARDEAERSLALAAQLSAREQQLQRAQDQLQEARRQLSAAGLGSGCMSDQESLASMSRGCGGGGGPITPPSSLLGGGGHSFSQPQAERGSCSADSGVRGSSDRESAAGNLSDGGRSECAGGVMGPTITVDPDSVSIVSSSCAPHMYQSVGTPKERSPTLSPLNAGAYSRSVDAASLSRSVEQLGSPLDAEPPPAPARRAKGGPASTLGSRTGGRGGGTWGSISRVFARSKHRSKMALQNDSDFSSPNETWSPLTEEGYAEKLRLLREASTLPIERWRAPMVLAWLEVALGMPQYGPRCAENIKSGKVLLELSDAELEAGLGTTHPMHRKKLRLAIEEQRRPELCRYPAISQLGHTWVAAEWLPDLGLAQYAENFAASMVDARMLDTLSKKELEKFLGVTRKFHQASVVHGIHLLRIMKYDRQALAIRRHKCETMDADPLVWTNQRFIRWARAIDLVEYADNLKDSGVHGGLVVLEPSFNGDTMATALGIPPNKNIIRRHLATELEALVLPARAMLGQGLRYRGPVASYGSDRTLGQASSRSYTTGLDLTDRRGSLRGSLSRAFKLRPRSDKMISPTPSSSSEGAYSVGPVFYAPPCPPGPPPSHRVSAPPPSGMQRTTFAQHRRVKSISDIEIAAAISSA